MKRYGFLILFSCLWFSAVWILVSLFPHFTSGQIWLISAATGAALFLAGWLGRPPAARQQSTQWDHPQVLEQFMHEIVYLKNTGHLANKLVNILRAILKTQTVLVLAKKYEKNTYCLWDGSGSRDEVPESLMRLLPWFLTFSNIIFRHAPVSDSRFAHWFQDLEQACAALKCEMLVPMVQGDTLVGLILVGGRPEGAGFTEQEMNMLERLRPLATIALNNSYLYGYVGNLSRELWEINRNLDLKVKERTLALEEALLQMKKMNEEQSDFFIMASHNLGTPLTAIKASLMLLFNRYPDLDPALRNIARENLQRLEQLQRSMLEISMLESNQLRLNYESCDVPEMIRELCLQVAPLYPDKTVAWEMAFDESSARLPADKERLQMVLFHLLSNACKYANQQARIKLSLSPAAPEDLHQYPGWAEDAKVVERRFVEFAVSDNGEGIPADELPDIFHKFYQVAGSSKRYQGVGLGLHLAKRIIEYHGGAIRAESRLGEGSVFRFVLPTLI
jgi:signal transduction histidine kinase